MSPPPSSSVRLPVPLPRPRRAPPSARRVLSALPRQCAAVAARGLEPLASLSLWAEYRAESWRLHLVFRRRWQLETAAALAYASTAPLTPRLTTQIADCSEASGRGVLARLRRRRVRRRLVSRVASPRSTGLAGSLDIYVRSMGRCTLRPLFRAGGLSNEEGLLDSCSRSCIAWRPKAVSHCAAPTSTSLSLRALLLSGLPGASALPSRGAIHLPA